MGMDLCGDGRLVRPRRAELASVSAGELSFAQPDGRGRPSPHAQRLTPPSFPSKFVARSFVLSQRFGSRASSLDEVSGSG